MQKNAYVISLFVSVGIISSVGSNPALAAQSPPSAPVTVVNTTANPVPVVQQGPVSIQGGVAISGTPNVNVANTPTVNLASGTTVNLASGATVNVKRDQIVRIQTFTVNLHPLPGLALYTVPIGKRLLVDYVSIGGDIDNGGKLRALLCDGPFGGSLVQRFFSIPLADQGEFFSANGTHFFAGSEKILADFEAGQTLFFALEASNNNLLHAWIRVTGTLIDATDPIVDVEKLDL